MNSLRLTHSLARKKWSGHTNFFDISGPIIIHVSGDTATNYLDVGAATNVPSRFYRVRLVP